MDSQNIEYMKKIVAFIVIPFLFCSCVFPNVHINIGSKNKVTVKCEGPVETRSLPVDGDFSQVEINGGFKVNLVNEFDSTGVVVTANNDVFDYLKAYTKDKGLNRVLVLEYPDTIMVDAEKCEITLVASYFDDIEINGAADLKYLSPARSGNSLNLELNGAGNIDIQNFAGPKVSVEMNGAAQIGVEDIYAQELEIELNGAGKISVSGEVTNASIEVNGAGVVDASSLSVANTPRVEKNGLAVVKLK